MVKITVHQSQRQSAQHGFTLLELSVVLTILAILIGGGLVIGTAQLEQSKITVTKERLDTIETMLENYVTAFNRLPCPANITLATSDANFGTEDRTAPDACDAVANEIFNDGEVFGSAVPVRTLQLPDNFMFDGWGHRFFYAVDQRATEDNSFDPDVIPAGAVSAPDFSGDIAVDDINGNCATPERADPNNGSGAIVVILSHSINGHNAWTRFGGNVASRIDSGVTHISELENSEVQGSFDECFVQADRNVADTANPDTTTFDDIARYKVRFQFGN